FAVVRDAIARGPIPGAAMAVRAGGSTRFAFEGRHLPFTDSPAVAPDTVWDLASLTKVLCTVPLLVRLVERGIVDPRAPLADAFPDARGTSLGARPLLEVVSHTAGLNAYSDLRWWELPREDALRKALCEPTPRERGVIHYSDQGFIALGYLLERHHGRRLDEVARDELYAPLGVGLGFNPPVRESCAPTEIYWGNPGPVQGTVHDENAASLGGVSGHAGLFGTVGAVAAFLEAMMDGRVLTPDGVRFMSREVARAESDRRAFGWVLRHDGWSGGDAAPEGAIGHTGFTGTGVWLHPESGRFNVLLTNRVYPTRNVDSGIVPLRRSFNDAAWRESAH
ncbi:MAG TPA: serine hydrolase domain-containing protein, partial [Deinococcales bacterium]|nr:serine hydrolase domain-containing protein [Deinococcales bacterium]